jgi:glutathione reductase (NADPH)
MDKKNKELQRLNGVYDKLLAKAGVTYIEGRGKLVDAHTVDVDGKRYTVRGYNGMRLHACWLSPE